MAGTKIWCQWGGSNSQEREPREFSRVDPKGHCRAPGQTVNLADGHYEYAAQMVYIGIRESNGEDNFGRVCAADTKDMTIMIVFE